MSGASVIRRRWMNGPAAVAAAASPLAVQSCILAAAGLGQRSQGDLGGSIQMTSAHDQGGRFLSEEHDHRHCMANALDGAKAVCTERGARLTPVRQRVLEIVWQSHRPLGAYAILDVLSGEGHSPAPPTVYRALEFLLANGLVHRLSSLNAFIGCSRPGHPGAGQFLICTACGTAAELHDAGIERAIEHGAEAEGFTSHVHTVEISGLCPHCRDA